MTRLKNPISSKNFKKALSLVATLTLMFPASAGAVSDSTLITKPTSSTKSGPWSRFNFESGFEYSQSIAKGEQSKREESMDISLAPGYKINDTFKLSLRSYLSKENTGAQETEISDTVLTLSIRGFKLSPSISSLHSITGVLPTSEASRNRDRLRGALGFSNGLNYASPLLNVTYRLAYSQNFHEYNINAEGSANVQHRVSNSLGLQLNVTDKFYLTSLGIYRWGQTYGGKERSAFEIHGDINYDVMDKMTLNLGTSNAGQAFKANGVDSNISAYDEDTSAIRAGISISL